LIRFGKSNQGSGAAGISSDILQKKFSYHRILEGFAKVQKSSDSLEIGLFQDKFSAEPRVSSSKQNEAWGLPNWAHLVKCAPIEILQDVLEHIIPFAQTGCGLMISCKKNSNCQGKNFGWFQKYSDYFQSRLDNFKSTLTASKVGRITSKVLRLLPVKVG